MSTEPDEQTEENREELMEAWKTSEDVAMHFNVLLLGFRLKAIVGIALGAVVSIGFKFDQLADRVPVYSLVAGLAVIWHLVWAVDFLYYYRLLAGAIDELIRLERRLGNVHLSHLIERRVWGGGRADSNIESIIPYNAKGPGKYPSWPIWLFYVVPAASLIVLAIFYKFNPPTNSVSWWERVVG